MPVVQRIDRGWVGELGNKLRLMPPPVPGVLRLFEAISLQ